MIGSSFSNQTDQFSILRTPVVDVPAGLPDMFLKVFNYNSYDRPDVRLPRGHIFGVHGDRCFFLLLASPTLFFAPLFGLLI